VNWLIAGGMINSALFLMGVFAASLVEGNHVVTVLALVSCGLAVLHYTASLVEAHVLAISLHYVSNLLAVVGALVLVVGYFI